jgi:hypothetical protein
MEAMSTVDMGLKADCLRCNDRESRLLALEVWERERPEKIDDGEDERGVVISEKAAVLYVLYAIGRFGVCRSKTVAGCGLNNIGLLGLGLVPLILPMAAGSVQWEMGVAEGFHFRTAVMLLEKGPGWERQGSGRRRPLWW